MIKSPDVPRLYKTGTLIAGDFKILDVHLEDWLKPLAWLLEMYDHKEINREHEIRKNTGLANRTAHKGRRDGDRAPT